MRQVPDFKSRKNSQKKICMITCYDYPSARIIAESNIDCVLVGDSVAMAVHGHSSTIMATLDMMALHTAAVARGTQQQLIISDLPFLCHRVSLADTVLNARTMLQAGAHALKIEGADADVCNTIRYLVNSGVPVMGHIGLTPQSVLQLGGYRVQGRDQTAADKLMQDAAALESAGCFAIVIECVPGMVAKKITNTLSIPTIGIGAGVETDGQVLVWHDLLGLQTDLKPRFVKQFTESKARLSAAIDAYAAEVHQAQFPTIEHTYL